jgi:hypothetical protein
MADQSPSPFSLPPMVVVGLIMAAVGVFTYNQRPFQDARPVESRTPIYRHTPAADQDVEARLWEDPLAAVAVAREADERKARSDQQACFDAWAVSSRRKIPLPAECYLDVDKAPTEQRHSLESLHQVLSGSGKDARRIPVLGAFVSGAPYADDMETRRRTRYAILSGLYRSFYAPVNHEHIGYVILSNSYSADIGVHDIAAYELFESDPDSGPSTRVLLMWLDQDGFRKAPLEQFSKLVNIISPPGGAIASIIGPADSDGLRSMASELVGNFNKAQEKRNSSTTAAANKPCLTLDAPRAAGETSNEIYIYSPRATAADEEIADAATGSTEHQSGMSLAEHFHCWSPNVHLDRTATSDKLTAQAMWRALLDRGVHDYNDLVLVTERDSFYARLIGKYFGGCKNPPHRDPASQAPIDSKPRPLCMTYLRGLDGLTPPNRESGSATSRSHSQDPASANSQPEALPVASEDASGNGQLDYLRRLAASLSATQGASDCKSPSGGQPGCAPRDIKAIGIIGSDIYDKLLVLQALRDTFPRATFFTFDMDARLFETRNLHWTRQVLVASTIGLALRAKLQGDVPPFRDTYQTTAFFSTMLAVHRAFGYGVNGNAAIDAGLGWTQTPRIFEIGRSRPFDLTNDPDIDTDCDFDGKCPSIAASRATQIFLQSMSSVEVAVSLGVVATTVGLFLVSKGRAWMMGTYAVTLCGKRRSGRRFILVGGIAIVLAVAVAMVWHALIVAVTHDNRSVPSAIFGGASPWASNLFELLSVIVVVGLVARGQRKLGDNAEKMRTEFGLPNSCRDMVTWSTRQVKSWALGARIREFFWFPFTRLSGYAGESLSKGDISPLEALVAQYLHRGTLLARSVRVAIATLVSTLVLYYLESIPILPLGGGIPRFDAASFEQWFGSGISLLSLCAMQFLVFWVADAVLLSRSFMLALGHVQPQWPAQALTREQKKVDLPGDQATLWLNLQLVARRTRWVSNLIWYPSCVIAAMSIAAISVEFGKFRLADNPIALAICAALIIVAVWQIRRAAETWRAEAIDYLEDSRSRSLAVGVLTPCVFGSITQLDRLLDRVSNLREGAFAPLSSQPIVRAVLLPLVTYAATFLLQYSHVG